MKTFVLKTFGCQMNKDDSERITGLLRLEGYSPCEDESVADLFIYNTCCVRESADKRFYGQAAALKQLKEERPALLIAVGGCLAQMDGDTVLKKLPHVDIVFGTHNVGELPNLIKEVENERQSRCEIKTSSSDFTGDLPAERKSRWRAWLPIMVGCDNFCTYCIVPAVRGREKSRPKEILINACRALVEDGVEEITLLGQNVNSYGRDLYGETRFAELLTEAASVKGLKRVRFTTSHPKDLEEKIIDIVASEKSICSHFHLPLQSGSDSILKLMGRRYNAATYLRLLERIRSKVDDVSITTDIIVGFPNETEEDFLATLDVVKTAKFDQAFTFKYSARPGTAAANFENKISNEVVKDRFDRLLEAQNLNAYESNQRMLGKTVRVFIEGMSKKKVHPLAARTDSNKLVHLDGGRDLIGKTVDVQINEAFTWFLIGERKGGK